MLYHSENIFQKSKIKTDENCLPLVGYEAVDSDGCLVCIDYECQIAMQQGGMFVACKLYFFPSYRAKQVYTGYGKPGVLQTC